TLAIDLLLALSCACLASAQFGGTSNWNSWGGGPQRNGWEAHDNWLTKENAKDIRLLWKRKLKNGHYGPHAVLPPVVEGGIISYAGIRELAIVGGASGKIWAIQADFNRTFWKRQLDHATNVDLPGVCPGGITATPAMMRRSIFGGGYQRRSKPNPIRQQPIYAVSGDGMLHRLNPSTGGDLFPPVHFLPAHAKASSLAAVNGVIYTTTSDGCGGAPNAVWAIDMSGDPATVTGKVASFVTKANPVGLGGPVVEGNGTVYVQTSNGKLDALTAKTLQLKGSFTIPGGAAPVTPAVFNLKGQNLVVVASKNGRLYLLNSQSLTGGDPAAVNQTQPLSSQGAWGAMAIWRDSDSHTLWLFVPVRGSVDGANAPHGAIVAFKVEDQNGKPTLVRAWVSPDMRSPEPPVTTTGIVFALDAGPHSHATLYALDATTGKQLYSTGDQVAASAALTGITVANGRVYFATTDNTLWQFGIYIKR
ncbi:MAG: PQQ-binding-like beta-propeller repeat protein, partial [Bryobacteraceae bacterium]